MVGGKIFLFKASRLALGSHQGSHPMGTRGIFLGITWPMFGALIDCCDRSFSEVFSLTPAQMFQKWFGLSNTDCIDFLWQTTQILYRIFYEIPNVMGVKSSQM
jgi:hypothetical protein